MLRRLSVDLQAEILVFNQRNGCATHVRPPPLVSTFLSPIIPVLVAAANWDRGIGAKTCGSLPGTNRDEDHSSAGDCWNKAGAVRKRRCESDIVHSRSMVSLDAPSVLQGGLAERARRG